MRRLGALAPVAALRCRPTAPDRADRISIATRRERDPRGRRRALGPASFRLSYPGRRCPDGSARIGNRSRRADRPDPRAQGADDVSDLVESEGMATTARDFLAFGTVRWMLRDLTIAMGHSDTIDYESLTRELLAGAHQWRIDDWASAVNRLRAAFEILTQARERFYPVDAYLIDLCLIDPAMTEGVLADPLARPIAISFVMPAQAIENQALHDPERVAALAAGNQRRLGRRRRRHVYRGGRRTHAARVDPLAIPARRAKSIGFTSRIETSRHSRGGDLACIPAFPRSPSGLDFGTRCP